MGILDAIFSAAFEGDGFNPVMGTSTNYKHWISVEVGRGALSVQRITERYG